MLGKYNTFSRDSPEIALWKHLSEFLVSTSLSLNLQALYIFAN